MRRVNRTKEIDALDVSLMTEKGNSVSLPQVVAARRLYLLNGRGEFELVDLATYWKEDDLLSTCGGGYEFNEDGDITRDFRQE